MIVQAVQRPRYRRDPLHSFPWLVVDVDGREAWIGEEQRLINYGAVRLTGAPEEPRPWATFDAYTFTVPPDPDQGRPAAETMKGFTADPRIVDLTRRYLYEVAQGIWRVGPAPAGE